MADDTLSATDPVPDEIVRSTLIRARPETVYGIIREPGWFINDGEYRPHEISADGDLVRVVDPVHGTFQLEIERRDPPNRIAFRWLGGGIGDIADAPHNTVEFSIRPEGGTVADGVVLTVRERGFAKLGLDEAVRRRNYEENLAGWEQQLELAKALAENGRGGNGDGSSEEQERSEQDGSADG
ncbi:polyketide cyclase [Brachybacterium aquaticum]|uniref:Uncharacterized protein YndB with AHSA1/START domain n=1 Tax=Brachybacterium aquaticum TaxID=1432564 RepID=A0A841AD38_9MICO|nr:polyketide cyclase [Brachybacterium aquaticum]MBB5833199.1 uncharacterized protein YndB with AHSA1/START domain [Brachybacterium aquaticum]